MQNETLRQAQIALEESRDRYVDLYDFAPVGYLTLTSAALIAEINLCGAALLGEERSKLIHRRFSRFVTGDDRNRWSQDFMRVMLRGDKERCETVLQRADGSRFQAQLDYLRLEKFGAEPVVHIALTDITARKQAEEELRIAAIAFESQQGMMVTDANRVIVRVNQAFTRLTGYSAEEAVGQTPALLKSGRHDQAYYQRMWDSLKQNKYWQGQIWNRRKNGKIYADWQTISAVTAPDGRVTHYVSTYSNITHNPEAEAEIYRLAYYDPLTQLPNRRLLQDRLVQALAATARSGHCGAILFLDMDNFKTLNDTRGHDVGDLLLVEVAQRLHACLRGDDMVARLGGDEFVMLLENLSGEVEEAAAQSRLVGDKVQEVLASPYHLRDSEYHCTTSIGIGLFCNNNVTVEELLKHADLAMYRSKTAGRNTLHFFDPAMQTAQDERSALETDLRLALKHQQLQLYYQPQMESTHGLVGAEALLRWVHPERGLVAPGEFIPLAEETRLVLPIGLWVLETACAQIKAWENNPHTRELRIAVNVSARQIHQQDFVAQVQQVLLETGANPTRLKIEMAESLMFDNLSDTITKMQALRAIGVSFSMDDFGTGYSSLSYLTRLPLDQIKIDQSFISAIGADPNGATMVQAIITMGNALGLNVIAEGVETEAQQGFLDLNGCHTHQGYLFSRALPLAEFEQFMNLQVALH
ncbi:MAG: EAL domain-containing protein [Gammaproteobacteria bacterium]|nr:EAL domain-containing protein [Gammaproteobacteria bacterium]MBU1978305.1 EAL domain-containing protein [Gammaproteobacteria bacterium]